MKRLIIDSKKMTPEIMALVKEKYPEGYFEDDIIVFKNQKNETIEAIQVEAPDAIYLIKIGRYLSIGLENFEMDHTMVETPSKPREIEEEEKSQEEDERKEESASLDEDDDIDED